jgi:hypothetical protein
VAVDEDPRGFGVAFEVEDVVDPASGGVDDRARVRGDQFLEVGFDAGLLGEFAAGAFDGLLAAVQEARRERPALPRGLAQHQQALAVGVHDEDDGSERVGGRREPHDPAPHRVREVVEHHSDQAPQHGRLPALHRGSHRHTLTFPSVATEKARSGCSGPFGVYRYCGPSLRVPV